MDKQLTPRQLARQMVLLALNGRMSDLYDEVTRNDPDASELRQAEVHRHLDKYLDQMEKLVRGKPTKGTP